MILLDTNIVSEFMTSAPDTRVLAWLNAQSDASLYFSTVSIAEVEFGLCVLPQGKRRALLSQRFHEFLEIAFGPRILAFDEDAARSYGAIRARRRALGRPMSAFDAQIAAIARTRGLTVATRNTRDFADCGVDLLNPFLYPQG